MTLTKKKSRGISVNDERYRFQVSSTKTDNEGNYSLNLTIQSEENKGSALKVHGLVTRNFWLDFPDFGTEVKKEEYPVITPKHISNIIKLALNQGWEPNSPGAVFEITVKNEQIFE